MAQFYQIISFAGVFFYWLLIAGVTMRLALRRRPIGVSFAWLMVIYILPVIGVVFYFLFGELNLGRKRVLRTKAMFSPYQRWFADSAQPMALGSEKLSSAAKAVHDICLHRVGIPAISGNQLTLHDSADKILTQITEQIESAQLSVSMVFYIWQPGGKADAVAQAVCQAAQRGVQVRILLDWAGSKLFFQSHWPQKMRESGVTLVGALAVSPMRMFFRRLDLRQHRKLIIVDEKVAYTGSMNMVDPSFFKQDAGIGPWVDIVVEVRGCAVAQLVGIFSWDWEVETGVRSLPSAPQHFPPDSAPQLDQYVVQVAPSGPSLPDGLIQQILLLSIHSAKKKLIITTPYLVPSETLLHALQTTAQRGVEVSVVIPAKNDNVMVEWASRSFFEDLLHAGVKIYQFNHGLLHTKSVMVDDTFCLIGTVNLDMRSLWLNFELTLCVDDENFCAALGEVQKQYVKNSSLLSLEKWQRRPLLHRLVEQFFYLFSPIL
ncbi:MAG: cardiolipin synthase [Enterovibrio sp.]